MRDRHLALPPGQRANALNGLRVTRWDRFLMSVFPKWGLERVTSRAKAELLSRHFEAAQGGHRTDNWYRSISDANAANGPALAPLRELARDLRRNNGWAKRGIQAVVNNTVGWGIMAKPTDRSRARSEQALEIWNEWATSTACDYDGRLDFYGLQRLVMETVAESGECLIIKQPASTQDGLSIPMRIHVVEPDYLDTNRNGIVGMLGGPIIDGVEFDKFGRRVAYWLYTVHPGSQRLWTQKFQSIRTPAERVLHIFRVDRPGQIRGVPWLAPAITLLKDFDAYEDAELVQQKTAACFSAFVTDVDGAAPALGGVTSTDDDGTELEALEPGHVSYLKPGQTVAFATPPQAQGSEFSVRKLRRAAASLGVTYEDLTGDYSNVNFSSARMARLAHWANVHEWRWHMLIPGMCNAVWNWAMADVAALEGWPTIPRAKWSPPPMPILEPDKEGLAYQRLIRNGLMTWQQVVSELGEDPASQLEEIASFNESVDDAGIMLDCDPRRLNQAGQAQSSGGGAAPDALAATAEDENEEPDDEGDDEDEEVEEIEGEDPPGAAAAGTLQSRYVKYIHGHKDSKGEIAPWVVVSHKTGRVLSSHKTEAQAKKALEDMHVFKGK